MDCSSWMGNVLSTMKRLGLAFVFIVVLLVLLCLVGCSANIDPKTEKDESRSVVFVIGNHANAPAPNASQFEGLLNQLVSTKSAIDVVYADGDPAEIQGGFAVVGSDAANTSRREKENGSTVESLERILGEQTADDEEVDLLESIRLAARCLNAYRDDNSDAGRGLMVISDSGLSTSGKVDFTSEGMLAADPAEVVEHLDQEGELVDLTGIDIECYFFGDVEEPQQKLSQSDVEQIKAIWKAIFEAGNAQSVVFKENPPLANEMREGLKRVSTVEVKTEGSFAPSSSEETVILRDTALRFKGDSDDFAYPEEAKDLLSGYAERMIEDKEATVHIIGTTASASAGSDKGYVMQLSLDRATKVKDTLVELGVEADRITVEGQGDEDPDHVDDLDALGLLIPEKAAMNRKVILEFSGLNV